MSWNAYYAFLQKRDLSWEKRSLRSTDGTCLWYKTWMIAYWETPDTLILVSKKLHEVDHQYPTIHAIERTQRELKRFIDGKENYTYREEPEPPKGWG